MKFQLGNKIGIQSQFKKGGLNPWKGKKLSEEHKKKLSLAQKNSVFKNRMIGCNNPSWKGGITVVSYKIRKDIKYRLWRSDIFKRDDFTCQECSNKGCKIQAHHIKPFSKIIVEYNIKTLQDALDCEELWDLNNGVTLCMPCHKETESFGNGK